MSDLSEFASRADTAEKKLALLSERTSQLEQLIAAMATSAGAPAVAPSMTNESKEFLLSQLNELRSNLIQEESARAALVTENEKLNYRVKHLIRSLEAEEKKVAELTKK